MPVGWRSHGTENSEAALKKASEAEQNIPGVTGFQILKVPPCCIGYVSGNVWHFFLRKTGDLNKFLAVWL